MVTTSLRVVTLNMWGRQGAWPDRRRILDDGFRAMSPDLVALQEVIVDADGDSAREVLGPDFHLAHSRARSADGMGIAIASRWPLRSVDEIDLQTGDRTADFPCATLVAEIDTPESIGPMLFANHFPSWQPSYEVEREVQTVRAARILEERVADWRGHVIVAGDLDADPGAASIRFWTGRQALDGTSVCYRDAWEATHGDASGETFSPENGLVSDPNWPFRRIDYILVRFRGHGGPTLAVADCRRIFDAPIDGTWASDHFGVLAELAVPTPPPRA